MGHLDFPYYHARSSGTAHLGHDSAHRCQPSFETQPLPAWCHDGCLPLISDDDMEWPHSAGIFCVPHPTLHCASARGSPPPRWTQTKLGNDYCRFSKPIRCSFLHSLHGLVVLTSVSWGSFYFPDTRPANKKDSTCGPTVFQSILHHHFCRIHLHSHQRLFLRLWKKGNGSHQGHGRGEGRRMPSQRFRVLSLTPSNTLNWKLSHHVIR